MGFCEFIDKYEFSKTHNAFPYYKTCVFKLKPCFFVIATHKMHMQFKFSFKNGFTLVLCNKINEFLTQAKCPVRHGPYEILLVCIVLQSLRRRSQQIKLFPSYGSVYRQPLFTVFFFCIQHLYNQRKTIKKFNLECLCLFYVPFDIQLLICFKESRRLFFFFMTNCYFLSHYRRSKYNYQKMFFYI